MKTGGQQSDVSEPENRLGKEKLKTREISFLKRILKTLLQPNLDYCSQLWCSLTNQGGNQNLKNIQRRFTKKVKNMKDINYWMRLKNMKLYSQERKMERYRVIYIWKNLKELVPNCGIQSYFSVRRGSPSSNSSEQLPPEINQKEK